MVISLSFMKMHVEMIWKLKLRYSKSIYLGLVRYINWIFVKSKRWNKEFLNIFWFQTITLWIIFFHGAKLLQISVKKWVPLIHKQTYQTNHETVLKYCTSEQTHKLTSQQTLKKKFIFHKIWFPQIWIFPQY